MKKQNDTTTTKGELLQDEYRIVLWEHNVYYRASKNSTWTHTVGNRRIHDKNLIEELNEAENKKYGAGLPRFFPAAPVPIPSEEYIERAVNNYQKVLDSNRELISILESDLETWQGMLEVEKISRGKLNLPEDVEMSSRIEKIKTAINNAKNIQP